MMLSLLTQDKFKELYEAAERKLALEKVKIAVELFSNFVQERKDTGRIYLMNVDPLIHTAHLLKMLSQLNKAICVVKLICPTKSLNNIKILRGNKSLYLSAINWGAQKV